MGGALIAPDYARGVTPGVTWSVTSILATRAEHTSSAQVDRLV